MRVLSRAGDERVALVYIGDYGDDRMAEFVESVQPPLSRDRKWVLIVSTLFGCPVGCRMCDAGGGYNGKLTADEIFEQIDYLVYSRYSDGRVPAEKFKIQFARMGEPALNAAVLEVLEHLPGRYQAPGLLPCVSTIAPQGCDDFLQKLLQIKNELYSGGRFQLQFSIHSTDQKARDWLMPVGKWPLEKIAQFGRSFVGPGDRKVTLNFAAGKQIAFEPAVLADIFEPDKFLIKITPLNPTLSVTKNDLVSYIDPDSDDHTQDELLESLRDCGYEVLLSIGELEENQIGSNCGQYISNYLQSDQQIKQGYTYRMEQISTDNEKITKATSKQTR